MRKFTSLLTIFYLLSFTTSSLFAQTSLLNGGFEQWENNTIYWNFSLYESSANISFFQSGSANVTPVDDGSGGSAIRLETVDAPDGETYAGTLFLGELGTNGLISTYPYTNNQILLLFEVAMTLWV